MKSIQRHVFVTGRVQGVGYRASTVAAAGKFPGLKGYVCNLPDGRVEAVFAGDEKAVLAMVEWCRQGPPMARVTDLSVTEEPFDPALPVFGIKR